MFMRIDGEPGQREPVMNIRKICKKCVLPESEPDIRLDEDGVCNICRNYEKGMLSRRNDGFLETDFLRFLDKHRKKRSEYDCLVMCSGGKDSTSALYYMKRRFKMNPLAFMFDHGFETEGAMENVKRAVAKLDVDFVSFRSTYLHDMVSAALKAGSRAVICHFCSIWYMGLTFRTAARFDIPIIIAGWTKGQSAKQPETPGRGCGVEAPEYASMAEATAEFINTQRKTPKYRNFPRSMKEVVKGARKRHGSVVLSPHWFLPFDAEEYVETIRKELGWDYPPMSYPRKSTNCLLNFISVFNSMKYYGYTHYHVEMSRHIREGAITREEALEALEIDFDEKLLNSIAKPLGFTFDG